MEKVTTPIPQGQIDYAAIRAKAQQLRAEALADMARTFGRKVAQGWAFVAHRPVTAGASRAR